MITPWCSQLASSWLAIRSVALGVVDGGVASWSSETNLWTIDATRTDTGEVLRFSARFLWMCQGYYRHAQGYTPEWPGMERYAGRIVHPQTWPEDLDYKDKSVVVIGSGATTARPLHERPGPITPPVASTVRRPGRASAISAAGCPLVPTATIMTRSSRWAQRPPQRT